MSELRWLRTEWMKPVIVDTHRFQFLRALRSDGHQNDLRFGVGHTKIRQFHFSGFRTYVKKFQWYGKGDGEFCRKHPERMASMIFHLLVRYPILHSWKAVRTGNLRAVPFFMLQGMLRFTGLVRYFIGAI